jgi:Superinfection immunity protein
MSTGDNSVLLGLGLLVAAIAIYFLPTIIAFERGHAQRGMVAVIDIFLGWTLVGWVVALAIACSATASAAAMSPVRPPVPAPVQPDTKVCPACAETVKAAATICRFCHHKFGTVVPFAGAR